MENPIIIERTFSAPASKVWKAITNRDDMRKWYFHIADFKAEVGFEFQFEGGDDNKTYLHLCKITEVIPGKKLTYSWRYYAQPGISYVTFELFEEENKTRLRLTHKGLDSFPAQPEFARKNFDVGWTEIIGTSLKNFVERKGPVCIHLDKLEQHLKQNGIRETHRGTTWGDEFGEWVYFDCRMNLITIREKFKLPDFINTHTNNDPKSGLEVGFYCPQCKYAIISVHPDWAGNFPVIE